MSEHAEIEGFVGNPDGNVENDNVTNGQVSSGVFSEGNLPPMLDRLSNCFEVQERKLNLLSCITVISCLLPNLFGKYRHEKVFANLYLYVIGKAGSGKGIMAWSKRLISVIERGNKQQTDTQSVTIRDQILNRATSETPVERRKILMPGNITSAGFVQLLSDYNGNCLIHETEGDTLANSFNSEHGKYSDMLRKAFHHETISSYRKTDREFVELPSPRISVAISSTPNQLGRIMADAENGLLSRFMFYFVEASDEFADVFATTGNDRNRAFSDASNELAQLYLALSNTEVEFGFTADQQSQFFAYFKHTQDIMTNLCSGDLDASVKRMGLILFRIAMVLSVLRCDANNLPEAIVCNDQDFNTALQLVEELVVNANEVLKLLPKQQEDVASTRKMNLFQILPEQFTTSEAKDLGSSNGLSDRTVDRFLKTSCFENVSHGVWRKAS